METVLNLLQLLATSKYTLNFYDFSQSFANFS